MIISLCLVVSTTSMPRNLPGSNFRLDEENADDAHYGTFQPQGKVKKPCTIPTAQHGEHEVTCFVSKAVHGY